MGLMPIDLLKARRESFVELYSYDNRGSSSYGTAGYLGDGYFITVKHGVVSLDPPESNEGRGPRVIETIKLMHRGRALKPSSSTPETPSPKSIPATGRS